MSNENRLRALLPQPSPEIALEAVQMVIGSVVELVGEITKNGTQRLEIKAWETTQLAVIRLQRDFLLTALDRTFDERRSNFEHLFAQLETVLDSTDDDVTARVSLILEAITDLAKSSPFKDLTTPEVIVNEFLMSGRAIEL